MGLAIETFNNEYKLDRTVARFDLVTSRIHGEAVTSELKISDTKVRHISIYLNWQLIIHLIEVDFSFITLEKQASLIGFRW